MEAINSKSELKESVCFWAFLQQVAAQKVGSGVDQGNLQVDRVFFMDEALSLEPREGGRKGNERVTPCVSF